MKKFILAFTLLILTSFTFDSSIIAGTRVSISLNKYEFKKNEIIRAKCTGLNKNIRYTVGVYKKGTNSLKGSLRKISGKTSATKQFRAPVVGKYQVKIKNSSGIDIKREVFKVTSGSTNPPVNPPVDPPVNPPSGSKNFTTSSGTTDLNYADTTAFINAYKGLGYSFKGYTKQVKISQLKSYLGASNNMHFHSGHGNPGSINCTDGNLRVSSLSRSVNVQYCIFATCLTLKDNGWYNVFGSNARMVMGFTEITTDGSCLAMAKAFPAKLKAGKSYLNAWYLTNSAIKQHQDRWATYVKENGRIVFYSAKGKKPYTPYYNYGKQINVSDYIKSYKELKNKWKSIEFSSAPYSATLKYPESKLKVRTFPTKPISITISQAYSKAIDKLGEKFPKDAILDEVIPIERCVSNDVCSVVGYNVYFVKEYDNLMLRSNSTTDYISVLVGNSGSSIVDYSWSKVSHENSLHYLNILTVWKALSRAVNDISNVIKQPVTIIDYSDVYGIFIDNNGNRMIVPAYEYLGNNGERFVVEASSGKLLN